MSQQVRFKRTDGGPEAIFGPFGAVVIVDATIHGVTQAGQSYDLATISGKSFIAGGGKYDALAIEEIGQANGQTQEPPKPKAKPGPKKGSKRKTAAAPTPAAAAPAPSATPTPAASQADGDDGEEEEGEDE